MLDPRFYERLAPARLSELATLGGASLPSGAADILISGVAGLEGATAADVSFCAGPGFAAALAGADAGACYVSENERSSAPGHCAVLVTPWPQAAFARAADRLVRLRLHNAGGAPIHASAKLEEGVVVAVGAVVGSGAVVGRNTYIAPGAVIGPGVALGRDCRIGAGARIGFALIGDGVHIHAGAVIGEAGFGAAVGPVGVVSLPQLGRVILQDNVRIGANSCVDRGAWADTVVGENTKIDNLVQIAHNVIVGRNCVLAAYTGVSGSTVIGEGCMLGARAGLTDHISVGDGARIAANSGVIGNVPAGETWGGYPARPVRVWMRQNAWLARAARRGTRGEGTDEY